MGMLTASELADMRATLADSLPDIAALYQRTQSGDAYGGEGETWSATGATIACELQFAGGDVTSTYTDEISGESVKPQQLYVVTTAYDAAITETHRLAIGGSTYDVVSQIDTRSAQISKRFLVKRV